MRAVPVGPIARCGRRFPTDTSPCQMAAMGEGKKRARGRDKPSPAPPGCRGAVASQRIPARASPCAGRGGANDQGESQALPRTPGSPRCGGFPMGTSPLSTCLTWGGIWREAAATPRVRLGSGAGAFLGSSRGGGSSGSASRHSAGRPRTRRREPGGLWPAPIDPGVTAGRGIPRSRPSREGRAGRRSRRRCRRGFA